MRQIVLDTETTGIDPKEGHRIIEIGGVELLSRQLTQRHYHVYLNPERDIDLEATQVHGMTWASLQGQPLFMQIVDEFLDFVTDSELLIHNAPFDAGFINAELERLNQQLGQAKYGRLEDYCQIFDTLAYARRRHPGQRNSLDALCKRYHVDNTSRTLHGALLDAEILADVYLRMTGGQTTLSLNQETEEQQARQVDLALSRRPIQRTGVALTVLWASAAEQQAHDTKLAQLQAQAGQNLWSCLETSID